MEYFEIDGGASLHGEIRIMGNKNEALPVLAALLLTDEEVVLKNVPEILDVMAMMEIMKELGTEIKHLDNHVYSFRTREIKEIAIPYELGESIRGSLLFAGAMLARCGEVKLPVPGGDKIGRRRVDTHFLALIQLGAQYHEEEKDWIHFSFAPAPSNDQKRLILDEASVTATENAMIFAAGLPCETIIYNAACEPHAQNLAHLLVRMGAEIEGIGSNRLTIRGCIQLKGTHHTIGSDHIETGSFLTLAATTRSALTLTHVDPEHLFKISMVFGKMGVHFQTFDDRLIISDQQELAIQKDFGGAVPIIDDGPWPQFPADLTSLMVVLATQCKGTVLVFEKMFESRLFFVDKLIAMGANIVLCDPHRAVITGPCQLHPATLTSPDIRAGMALLIAALCASGKSFIYNIQQIERGYESVEERLRNVGANIVKKHTRNRD